jgi:hypothetical protein
VIKWSKVVAGLTFVVPIVGLFFWGLNSISSYNMLPWVLLIGWFFVAGAALSLTPAGREATAQREAARARIDGDAVAEAFGGRSVVIRSYAGRNQVDAAKAFAQETEYAASRGYFPVAQSWSEGQPGPGRILALGTYSTVARPKGTLTVTYRRDEVEQPSI